MVVVVAPAIDGDRRTVAAGSRWRSTRSHRVSGIWGRSVGSCKGVQAFLFFLSVFVCRFVLACVIGGYRTRLTMCHSCIVLALSCECFVECVEFCLLASRDERDITNKLDTRHCTDTFFGKLDSHNSPPETAIHPSIVFPPSIILSPSFSPH